MSKQIKSTTDYSMFEFIKGNRIVSDRIKHLIARIKVKNQLADYPILCFQNGSKKLAVVDGQHRLEAARALGVPIFYHLATTVPSITDISSNNSLQKSWILSDYVHLWTVRGKQDYKYLKDYCDGYKISITYAAGILGGGIHRPSGADERFGEAQVSIRETLKNGTFKVTDKPFGEKVGPFLVQMKRVIGYSLPRPLVGALLRLCRLPTFSINRMLKKMETHKAMFLKCGTWLQYVDILEAIYNSHVRKSELTALKIGVQGNERRETKSKKK